MSLYLVQHPHETRLSLIVLVVDDAFARVDDLRARMYGSGCSHGMVIDERDAIVLRDTFIDADASSIKVDFRLDTGALIGDGNDLDTRVRRWLQRMSANWHAVLENLEGREKLLYDIVPALSGAEIDRIDGDAA